MGEYNIKNKLPKFIKTDIETSLFSELLQTTTVPKLRSQMSAIRLRFLLAYFKTADIERAYLESYGAVEEGYDVHALIKNTVQPHTMWVYTKALIYTVIKKLRRNDYVKLYGEIIDMDTIHSDWKSWLMTKDLFESKAVNTDLDFYRTISHQVTNSRLKTDTYVVDENNNPINPTRVVEKTSKRDQNVYTRPLLPEELINNAIAKRPEIAALHHAFEDITHEDLRKKVIAAHLTNLHFIAFDDEEKASDRIHASKEIIKVMGGYELDNRQKGDALKHAIESEGVKELLEAIKQKSLEIQRYLPVEDAQVVNDPDDLQTIETDETLKEFAQRNNYKMI